MNWEEQARNTEAKHFRDLLENLYNTTARTKEKKNTCRETNRGTNRRGYRLEIGNPKQSALELQLDEAGQAVIRYYYSAEQIIPPCRISKPSSHRASGDSKNLTCPESRLINSLIEARGSAGCPSPRGSQDWSAKGARAGHVSVRGYPSVLP